ncbi:iron chaperone [Streptomyces sp. NPDC101118]|uniref:iron chaperone n=1 Tax=Streptomyces sp. NPDC101118 TaxID=3366109 RepID=UPI0037FA9B48
MPSAKSPAEDSAVTEKYDGFSAEERAAMKDHARDQKKAAARRGATKAEKAAEEARDVLAKIAEMSEADRVLAERIHEIITTAAPDLAPKLWYGMPAYARNGKVVCHFQSAEKFKSRYATLGFSDQAALDDGAVWATSYAVKELTAADEERIGALVRKAVS